MSRIPNSLCSLSDYEIEAKRHLPPDLWAYISGSSMDGLTKQRNTSAYDQCLLQSRVLVEGLGQGSCQTQLFGQSLKYPLLIAPLAYQRLVHPMGEIATVQAALAQGVGFCLSTLSSTSIEAVADAASESCRWFQLYCQPDLSDTLHLINRAELAGYQALIVTVDAPFNGVRHDEQRAGFRLPSDVCAVNLNHLPKLREGDSVFECWMKTAPTWKTITSILEHTQLPVLLKGIMHPEDALNAVDLGVRGIVVSNHGGRVLDTQPASLEVLPLMRQVLPKGFPILVDGGIRRGSDVFKAIALGADAVLLGRYVLYALAVAGPLGVAHILRVLRDEFEATMALCGCARVSDISTVCLYDFPRAFSNKGG
ncbi:alpha-hydroxy acid oxidase [Nitrincola alkalisediminis]|uniref:alpha-hydroxy acid oxidase n=1 Tax=Nitrincola alkalisediminis TaxID=1366656 RepID=UPI0018761D5D|nr:alpha-hydroxy acid oxidase [Nitrincola alkalisediminis]